MNLRWVLEVGLFFKCLPCCLYLYSTLHFLPSGKQTDLPSGKYSQDLVYRQDLRITLGGKLGETALCGAQTMANKYNR